MVTISPARTEWTHVASRFFAVMIVLATLYALANAPAGEALLLPLAVVLPIAWITLRDARYSRAAWSVAAAIPVVVWIARALTG